MLGFVKVRGNKQSVNLAYWQWWS